MTDNTAPGLSPERLEILELRARVVTLEELLSQFVPFFAGFDGALDTFRKNRASLAEQYASGEIAKDIRDSKEREVLAEAADKYMSDVEKQIEAANAGDTA